MARTSNYSYVIDSTFDPFSFKELVQPLEVYKDAYEAAETQYTNLADNANTFKYLSESLPEGSKARAIYEGYANELNKQAQDFGKHGLNMGNRRALTNLKRRYQGEIGRLVKADKDLETEKALRRQLAAKDSSMLYAMDNLDIDQFLDGSTPNLYSISGTELYTRGAAAGKAASSRVYSAGDEGSTLNGYYRKWVERNGYSKESMDAFRANASAIPELQSAAEDILQERGVNDNLTGINRERAKQSVLNGIIDGAIYQEKISPVRDEGKMSAKDLDASARGWANYRLQKENAAFQRGIKAAAIGGGRSGAAYDVRNKDTVMIGASSGSMYRSTDNEGIGLPLEELPMRALTTQEYMGLVDGYGNINNEYLRSITGNGSLGDYEIRIIPAKSTEIDGSGLFSDDDLEEDVYVLIPRESKRAATGYGGNSAESTGGGSNDIPE